MIPELVITISGIRTSSPNRAAKVQSSIRRRSTDAFKADRLLAGRVPPITLKHSSGVEVRMRVAGGTSARLSTAIFQMVLDSKSPAFHVFNRYEPRVEQALLDAPLPALIVSLPPPLGDEIGRILPGT